MARHENVQARRRQPRYGLSLTALLVVDGVPPRICHLEDLAAGGARLAGSPPLMPGEPVRIIVRFPGGVPVSLSGEIARCEASTPAKLAVVFDRVRHDLEARIQGVVSRRLETASPPRPSTVLVVDNSDIARHHLKRDLTSMARRVVTAATPVEAIELLGADCQGVGIVMVEVALGGADGLNVLDYVASAAPSIRRIAMSGEQAGVDLRTARREGRVHGVLPKPWNRQRLAELISQPS